MSELKGFVRYMQLASSSSLAEALWNSFSKYQSSVIQPESDVPNNDGNALPIVNCWIDLGTRWVQDAPRVFIRVQPSLVSKSASFAIKGLKL